MRLYEVIWKDKFVDKIECKHKVTTDEVEEVLFSKPHTRRAEKGLYEVKICMWPMLKRMEADTWLYFLSTSTRALPCPFQRAT